LAFFFSHPAASILTLTLILVPLANTNPKRIVENDLLSLRKAECSYRGITATYEEVTEAYIIENYARGSVLGWRVQPNPRNPDNESLVTAIYQVEGPPKPDGRPFVDRLRSSAPPNVSITWRYSSLAAIRIEPANDYARDALGSFTNIVDSFISRMVVAVEDIALSTRPNSTPSGDKYVSKGTVLLMEKRENDWVEVRQPSSPLSGWAPKTSLLSVE
tara:strand:- start:6040 stop:6690 length:651 start_codon:yes stop_codon:yes gene_type:complete